MKTAMLVEFRAHKDVLVQMLVLCLVVCVVTSLSFASPVAMIACVGAMMPMLMMFTLFGSDAHNGWERYRAAMPASRASIVVGKYVLFFATCLAALVIAFCVAKALGLVVPFLPFGEEAATSFIDDASQSAVLVCSGLVGMCTTFGFATVMLPFIVRFGMTKAVRIVPTVIFLMLLPVFIWAADSMLVKDALFGPFATWLDAHFFLAMTALCCTVLLLYVISCLVSVKLYCGKEL